MLNKDIPFQHHQRTSNIQNHLFVIRAQNCHSKDNTSNIYLTYIIYCASCARLGDGWRRITKTNEFSEKYYGGGGGVIFNPKIYVADFGPSNRAF